MRLRSGSCADLISAYECRISFAAMIWCRGSFGPDICFPDGWPHRKPWNIGCCPDSEIVKHSPPFQNCCHRIGSALISQISHYATVRLYFTIVKKGLDLKRHRTSDKRLFSVLKHKQWLKLFSDSSNYSFNIRKDKWFMSNFLCCLIYGTIDGPLGTMHRLD